MLLFSFWRNYANHFDLISVIGGDFTIKITTILSNETIFDRKPRTFVITTNTHALIIRHPSPTYKHSGIKGLVSGHSKDKDQNKDTKVLVEFVLKEYLDLSLYRDITPKHGGLLGLLGLLNVKGKHSLAL